MGEIKSGTVSGHVLAASFFLGFGIFFLLLDLKRAHQLRPGQSFCELHVPERNPIVLRRGGQVLFFATVVGILWEGGGGVHTYGNFFFQLLHETLYLSFGFVGLVSYLESKRRLPLDSQRAALVVTLLLFYLMMSVHAKMKPGSTDGSLHGMLANLCLVHALILTYSVWNKTSLLACIMSHALLVMEGVWLITLGSYACCIDIPIHLVETWFSLELLAIFTIVVIAAAFALPMREDELHSMDSGAEKDELARFVGVDGGPFNSSDTEESEGTDYV